MMMTWAMACSGVIYADWANGVVFFGSAGRCKAVSFLAQTLLLLISIHLPCSVLLCLAMVGLDFDRVCVQYALSI